MYVRVCADSELNSADSERNTQHAELNTQRWKLNARHWKLYTQRWKFDTQCWKLYTQRSELDHDARGSFKCHAAGGDTRRSVVLSSSNGMGTSFKQKAPAAHAAWAFMF